MGLMSAGGGGLTNSKLALATAAPSDVISGKTFYAGDKVLKTGTATAKAINAGRCWANGYANGSGFASVSGYTWGQKSTYAAEIFAARDGYFVVWNNDSYTARWFNKNERLAKNDADSAGGPQGTSRVTYIYI